MTPASSASPARRATVLVAALLGAALTARLGVWQLDRAAQKVALQAQIEARAALPALDAAALAHDPAQAEVQQQRLATLQGHWVREATVFLDNRTMDGGTGFLVITPLRLASGDAVLVQRGWTPRDPMDRSRVPALALDAGEVRLQGRLAPWPSPLFQLGEPGHGTIRQNLDRDTYARESGLRLLPLSLQLVAAPQTLPAAAASDDGLRRHWWVPTADVQKHYGYAVQWFALSALIAGLYVWFQLLRPRLGQRRRA